MSAIEQTQTCLVELRQSLDDHDKVKRSGASTAVSSRQVKKSLIKLRRAHARMRDEQIQENKKLMDAVKSLHRAKVAVENTSFLENQCMYLVEKFNATQFPELEKVLPTLPSVEEYTAKHKDDADFVSYDSDPHQFLLNQLASELEERDLMEKRIKELEEGKNALKKDINRKREFLSSITAKVSDVTQSVEALVRLFEKQ